MKPGLIDFSVDKENKKITVERAFASPLAKVWAAWTEKELLEKWWAPKPWKAQTKIMDFREGGYMLYAMVGPEGSKHWARADYKKIRPMESIILSDAFCDEEGNVNTSLPQAEWTVSFQEKEGSTTVRIVIVYEQLADLEKVMEMGFREGFNAALGNLHELLEK